MSSLIVERSAITSQLLTILRTLNFPVGDNNSPTNPAGEPIPFGWTGEPDAAGTNFTPWLSLTPMPGNPAPQVPGVIMGLGEEEFWLLNYSLYVAGVNRNQCELLADRARNLLCAGTPFTVTGPSGSWAVAGIRCPNIGSNQRVGEAIPYYYTQADNYAVLVTEGT